MYRRPMLMGTRWGRSMPVRAIGNFPIPLLTISQSRPRLVCWARKEYHTFCNIVNSIPGGKYNVILYTPWQRKEELLYCTCREAEDGV